MQALTRGSLEQLNINENIYPSYNNVSEHIIEEPFNSTDFRHYFGRSCADVLTPEFLVLHLQNENITINDIKQWVNKISFCLETEDQIILDITLRILLELKEPILIDGKLYIHLPCNYFFGSLSIINSQRNNFICHIQNPGELFNFVITYNLVVKYKFFCMNTRTIMTNDGFISSEVITQMNTKVINLNEPSELIISQLGFYNHTKGFFIHCNIETLLEMKFYLNYNHLKINYNRFLISQYCERISDKLIYVPFFQGTSYNNPSPNSYEGSINFNSVNMNAILVLRFNVPQTNICISSLNKNTLVYHSGCVTLSQSNGSVFYYTDQNISQSYLESQLQTSLRRIPPRYPRMQQLSSTLQSVNDSSGNVTYPTSANATILEQELRVARSYYSSEQPNPLSVPLSLPGEIVINKKVNQEKKLCSISFEEIEINNKYMTCNICYNNFLELQLKRWFETKLQTNNIATCPCCRDSWNDYNIYLNIDDETTFTN